MKLSRLTIINEGFERLKNLDKEILHIEKLAEAIANRGAEITLDLKCTCPEDKKQQVLDSDGSLINNDSNSQSYFSGFVIYSTPKSEPKKNGLDYTEPVRDTLALQLLGVLLMDKQQQRERILDGFQKLGVEI